MDQVLLLCEAVKAHVAQAKAFSLDWNAIAKGLPWSPAYVLLAHCGSGGARRVGW